MAQQGQLDLIYESRLETHLLQEGEAFLQLRPPLSSLHGQEDSPVSEEGVSGGAKFPERPEGPGNDEVELSWILQTLFLPASGPMYPYPV